MERLAFTSRRDAAALRVQPEQPPESAPLPAERRQPDEFAFRALLAFLVVLLVRPQDTLPFLSPLHLPDVFGALAIVSLVAGRLNRGLAPTRVTPEVIGVFAFSAVMVATIPLSFWPGGSFRLFTDMFVKIVIIFLVMVNTLTTRQRLQKVVTLIVMGAGYVGTRAVVDYARGVNLVEGGRVAGAVGGLFGNPNDMALNMVSFLPLALGLALIAERTSVRLLGLSAAPVMIGALVFSKSRGGTVAVIVAGAVTLLYLRRLRPAVAALGFAAALAALPLLPASFTERMASIFDADQDPTGSREARKRLLREGWSVFLANPFVGIGAGQFTNYNPDEREETWRQTHNAALQVAAELGIVGLIPFGFMIWSGYDAALRTIRAARRRPRAPPAERAELWRIEVTAAMVVCALTGWFVAAMFASVAYYWTLYLVLGLAAAVRYIGVELEQREPGVRRRRHGAQLRVA